MSLDKDHSLREVAEAIGMSERWIRERIRKDGVAHLRYGHVIKFTSEQVEALRASHVAQRVSVPDQRVTTGRKKS